MQHKVSTLEETFALAEQVAKHLKLTPCLTLTGGLGAGKTTFAKKIIHELSGAPLDQIVSPTYNYVNLYNDQIAHFDLYRLDSLDSLEELGLEEILTNPRIIKIIEWPQIAQSVLPRNKIDITIDLLQSEERLFLIKLP
jgi:tRNA threonylcarbamoyl adenosine modification protein YjeE